MRIKFAKEFYPKEAILKAANIFTDDFYILLDTDDKYYYADINSKANKDENDISNKFINEALLQSARYSVIKQTQNIRELIIGRALASTVIDDSDTGFIDDETIIAENILHSWFDEYDK